MSMMTFAMILIAFLDLTKPASKIANPASIKKIRAAHKATQTVLIELTTSKYLGAIIVSSSILVYKIFEF